MHLIASNREFFAHVDPQSGRRHVLEDHLREVERRAALAADWPGGDWAGLAGLWHDLGKYSAKFQAMLAAADGGEAHIEPTDPSAGFSRSRVNHSSAGALFAVKRFGAIGRVLAYIIAGHHAGLADWSQADAGAKSLQFRLTQSTLLDAALNAGPPTEILECSRPKSQVPTGGDPAFWIRMLFSAVVDADFLDTEAFFDPPRAHARSAFPPLADLQTRLDSFLSRRFGAAADTPVNRARAEVLAACRAAAQQPAGLFALTVPTGGGKTLSSLAFALEHARRHGLRRVIYVIPYTSIIEQTADVFREAVGPDAVVEHHSNLEPTPEKETARTRLACENWDAPLIVTTSVQFFESLFAARPGSCRKLHNIAHSVVILDEAQLLPPRFLRPVLHALDQLLNYYGTSVVLCTATQPALHAVFRGFKPREIMPDPAGLYRALNRVELSVPADLAAPVTWTDLAEELRRRPAVLCIVNRRDDCRRLHALMPEGTVHLSTFMCGAHRAKVIADVKRRLADGEPVRVVSTQLVEAGVDMDFPCVFRALAGLDSLAQAAGRCNREGRLPGRGEFVVFVPESKPPPGDIAQAAEIARRIIEQRSVDMFAPDAFDLFFGELYWLRGAEGLDGRGILALLGVSYITDGGRAKFYGRLEYAFRTAAERFRFIDDVQVPIIVGYGEGAALIEELQFRQPNRESYRRLQRHMVPVPRHLFQRLVQAGIIAEAPTSPGLYVQHYPSMYRDDIGVVFDEKVLYEPGSLIV